MTLIAENVETDTRERILVVAERLFRQIGYQKTTVGDIAKELRMSPANVYRFFDSKKAIHEGVARSLMGEVENEAEAIANKPGPAVDRMRELLTTVHRMNCERYVGDSKLHEMVEIAMEESWEVCVAHMQIITETIGGGLAPGGAASEWHVPSHGRLLSSADDRPGDEQARQAPCGDRPDGRFRHRGARAGPEI